MKTTRLVLVFATTFGLGFGPSAWAQANLEARITISFSSVSPAMLFRSVASMSRCEATVDPALQKPISITLEDVTLRTALNAICDSVGCRWTIDNNRLMVQALPPDPLRGKTWLEPQGMTMPAGMQFVNVPVKDVLDAMARVAGEGFEYSVDEIDVNRLVTVDVSSQNVVRAIAMVVKAAGLGPGAPYTISLRRPGQKLTLIKTQVPKDPESDRS